jgi:hypothetical protein
VVEQRLTAVVVVRVLSVRKGAVHQPLEFVGHDQRVGDLDPFHDRGVLDAVVPARARMACTSATVFRAVIWVV